jgi:L-aspartate oxidase
MTEYVGVLRTEDGLREASARLPQLAAQRGEPGVEAWENTNLVTIACALTEAALHRQETRGSHWREDFPDRDDEHWAGHFDTRLVRGGIEILFQATPATDGVVTASSGGTR